MPAPHNSADTPVMRQFLEIKARYPDAILMFRMGDFYELFFDDAVEVAPILDIALTSRDKGVEDPVPMAGVPYHALGGYLRTLVERGMKVAICEQMETPEAAKKRKGPKIVRREVVRVVSPGALVDDEHLRSGEPNRLVSVAALGRGDGFAVAACDISSGEFTVSHVDGREALRVELARLSPREVLADPSLHGWLATALGPELPRVQAPPPLAASVRTRVRGLLAESGLADSGEAVREAAGSVLAYAEATQPGQTLLLHRIHLHDRSRHVVLDDASLRNLEIFRTLRDGSRKGSLIWALDATRTAMGARMLRDWVAAPSAEPAEIHARQAAIASLLSEPRLRSELQSRLKDVRDVIRLAARTRLGTVTPRELGALRSSLAVLPGLQAFLGELCARRIDRELPALVNLGDDLLEDVVRDLEATLVDQPPAITREGGMIRSGCDAGLDEHRRLRDGGREALAAIEARERERTQIPTLKVQHNRVFGYFIEVSRSHLARVPDDYVRKQTLANAERFVTEELAGHESKVLGAQAQALEREHELFAALRGRVSAQAERLLDLGERIATLDVLAGLAELAERHDYCRPTLVPEPVLDIEDGRHPVVERMLAAGKFVPNDVRLRAREQPGWGTATSDAAVPGRLWVITGPNMGGKSTIMRQSALIVIMAHVGSYVPARTAEVGLCDRVFTRVGAADDLGRGESTFMVEMRETAQILNQATARSLVLLDEIGRGTATFDGLALAWAITEFIHDQIGARTLFATHYHELCGLEEVLEGVRNVHVSVQEHRGKIVFLHRLEPGAAGRSYGVAVGRLAGLPAGVLRRATRILERLEAQARSEPQPQLDLFAPTPASERVVPSGSGVEAGADMPAAVHPILAELAAVRPDDLSPRAAHELLRELSERMGRQ